MNNIRQIYARSRDNRGIIEIKINRLQAYTRGVWVFMVVLGFALFLMMVNYSEVPPSYENYVASVKSREFGE